MYAAAGSDMAARQCFHHAAELDPLNGYAFALLAYELPGTDCVEVNGVSMNALQCYLKAAELEPECASAFVGLGKELIGSNSIDVNGVSMTQRDCYQRALKINPNSTDAQTELQRLDQADAAPAGPTATVALPATTPPVQQTPSPQTNSVASSNY